LLVSGQQHLGREVARNHPKPTVKPPSRLFARSPQSLHGIS
jgi:hypothetical protein